MFATIVMEPNLPVKPKAPTPSPETQPPPNREQTTMSLRRKVWPLTDIELHIIRDAIDQYRLPGINQNQPESQKIIQTLKNLLADAEYLTVKLKSKPPPR
jgi:hypothetical protein